MALNRFIVACFNERFTVTIFFLRKVVILRSVTITWFISERTPQASGHLPTSASTSTRYHSLLSQSINYCNILN